MIAAPAVAASHVSIRIDAGKPGPVINKYVYGQFAEHLGTGVDEGMYVALGRTTIPGVSASAARAKAADVAVDVAGIKVTGAAGNVLTATAMDAHNTFRNPQVIKPAAFSARAVGGKLSVKVPAKAVMVLALEE